MNLVRWAAPFLETTINDDSAVCQVLNPRFHSQVGRPCSRFPLQCEWRSALEFQMQHHEGSLRNNDVKIIIATFDVNSETVSKHFELG